MSYLEGNVPAVRGLTPVLSVGAECSVCRYFCPDGRTDYPSWSPKAVADKECTPVSQDVLDKQPFPPGASVLIYGNSHLRQVTRDYPHTATIKPGRVIAELREGVRWCFSCIISSTVRGFRLVSDALEYLVGTVRFSPQTCVFVCNRPTESVLPASPAIHTMRGAPSRIFDQVQHPLLYCRSWNSSFCGLSLLMIGLGRPPYFIYPNLTHCSAGARGNYVLPHTGGGETGSPVH